MPRQEPGGLLLVFVLLHHCVATLIHVFRFAKIIQINSDSQTAHVQWFEHSSKTAMGEISDAQELFLTDICDEVNLQCIVGKAKVHSYNFLSDFRPTIPHNDFYCK